MKNNKVFDYLQLSRDVVTKKFDLIQVLRRNIGVREFGKMIGIAPATFSRICNGGKPDLETLIQLLDWLDKKFDNYVIEAE